MFVGRNEELEILNKRYNSEKFEFGYLYGQRRIGKTSLIDEFAKNKNAILFFASDSDDISIRMDFSKMFFEQIGEDKLASFNNWEDFFKALANYFKDRNGLVVIDEYPNIVIGRDGKPKKTDFVYKLQDAIDHEFKNTKILFIITGSNVSFMEKAIKDSNAPLYKRHTFELMLSKLEWNDAIKMLDKMNNIDKIKTLALCDTYPYYLSHIDVNLSFDDNLNQLFFSRDALFITDPSTLITSEVSIAGFYASIMRFISEGYNTVSSLANVLNAESGKISIYLEELIKIKAIAKYTIYGTKRSTYYKIIDRMCAFYFKYIFQNTERIKLGYGAIIKSKYDSSIDTFLHHSFEDICITYLEYLNKNMRLPQYFDEFQNYRVENSKLGRSIEIDIVGHSDNGLLIGECKLSKTKKTINEYNKMKEDTSVPPFVNNNLYYYIFSSNGFDKELMNLNDPKLKLIDLEKMFNK